MNTQLENAIQEAMTELDKVSDLRKPKIQMKSEESNLICGVLKDESIDSPKPHPRMKTHLSSCKRNPDSPSQNTTRPVGGSTTESSVSDSPAHSTRLRKSQR